MIVWLVTSVFGEWAFDSKAKAEAKYNEQVKEMLDHDPFDDKYGWHPYYYEKDMSWDNMTTFRKFYHCGDAEPESAVCKFVNLEVN